jgi:hypothetical protein
VNFYCKKSKQASGAGAIQEWTPTGFKNQLQLGLGRQPF